MDWGVLIISILSFWLGWNFCGDFIRWKELSKKGKRLPLFRTNDGVQMFLGDRYWYIGYGIDKRVIQVRDILIKSEKDCCMGFAQFSTREKAMQELVHSLDDREKGEE